jgi:hypothetical protein
MKGLAFYFTEAGVKLSALRLLYKNFTGNEHVFALYFYMRFVNLLKLCYLLALILLMSQIIGLVFCGDVNCLRNRSDETCAALVCSLLSKHSTSTSQSSSSQNSSCQCFCHISIDLPETTLYAAPLVAMPLHTTEVNHLFSEPIRNIDHPPSAQLC